MSHICLAQFIATLLTTELGINPAAKKNCGQAQQQRHDHVVADELFEGCLKREDIDNSSDRMGGVGTAAPVQPNHSNSSSVAKLTRMVRGLLPFPKSRMSSRSSNRSMSCQQRRQNSKTRHPNQ